MPTETQTRTNRKTQGFPIRCPHCGAMETREDAGPVIAPGDLSILCRACEEPISRLDLERVREGIDRLLRWLNLAETV